MTKKDQYNLLKGQELTFIKRALNREFKVRDIREQAALYPSQRRWGRFKSKVKKFEETYNPIKVGIRAVKQIPKVPPILWKKTKEHFKQAAYPGYVERRASSKTIYFNPKTNKLSRSYKDVRD